MSITSKQEKFAQCVASGMTQSDAYRASYDVSDNAAIATINNDAYKLMSNPDIYARVNEIREPIVKKAQISLESHLEALKELRDMARDGSQYSAAITAEVARGKASGLYVEKNEIVGELNVTKIVRTIVKAQD